MKNVFLINTGKIPHYRVPVYGYLSDYLKQHQFRLVVISEGVQEGNPNVIQFPSIFVRLCFSNLSGMLINRRPDAVIFWVGPHFYMFPLLILARFLKIRVIHWGHRRPVPPHVFFKRTVYNIEHWLDNAIIIYSEELRKHIWRCFQKKTYVAINTLNLAAYNPSRRPKDDVRRDYGIFTEKNIICIGRIQRRKRISDLVLAFQMLNMNDVGLILAGPDDEGILAKIRGRNIFKFGPIYGKKGLDLLSIADIYCLPGSIGLGIVDALWCGLPVVTENVFHGPEITFLKNGINGFVVPKGDVKQLADKLRLLLTDDALRERFSHAARNEIMVSGHIEKMCEGFRNALQFVCEQ